MSYDRIENGLRVLLRPGAADGARCPVDVLYLYASDQTTPRETRELEAHLARCGDCRADLEAFHALDNAAPAPEPWTSRIARGLGLAGPKRLVGPTARGTWRSRMPRRRLALALPATAAVAALVLAVGTGRDEGGSPSALHVKGDYRLQVAVERGGRRFQVRSGDPLLPGDLLGFFYTAPAPALVTVLRADESGRVEHAFPELGAMPEPAGVEQPLPLGAVVEPGGGCEWLVAFFSPEPVPEALLDEALIGAIGASGPDCRLEPLPIEGTTADVFVVRKVDR